MSRLRNTIRSISRAGLQRAVAAEARAVGGAVAADLCGAGVAIWALRRWIGAAAIHASLAGGVFAQQVAQDTAQDAAPNLVQNAAPAQDTAQDPAQDPVRNAARAAGFSGLARVDPRASSLTRSGGGLTLTLSLSQGVPWRVYTLTDPPRAVLDFREVDWSGVEPAALNRAGRGIELRMGPFRPGWSRMVIGLPGPLALDRAGLRLDADTGRGRLTARFAEVPADRFAALSGPPPEDPGWVRPPPSAVAGPPRSGDRPLVVVLDAGHGGIDPGAERGGLVEKDLILQFARELEEVLLRSGGYSVVLSRPDDRFVSLERRVEIAHEAGADLFISLHADVVPEGGARGATVHMLSETATDAASAKLAERHDRDDLLSGIDLSGKDDEVAGVLLDLARMETRPRTGRLARTLVAAIGGAGLPLNSRPLRGAGFSVLKAADIPSVLIEIGFLSDERDRRNLADPAYRARVARAIRDGIRSWAAEDAALAPLVRR